AARHTTMIRASMTAYSTAVGPSSRRQNSTTAFFKEDNIAIPLLVGKADLSDFRPSLTGSLRFVSASKVGCKIGIVKKAVKKNPGVTGFAQNSAVGPGIS